MNIWKNYIKAGNERFAANDYNAAVSLYDAARVEAENLFLKWKEPEEAVAAVIVSYHNMADLYQQQGLSDAARLVLERVHQYMLHAVISTPITHKYHTAIDCALVFGYINHYTIFDFVFDQLIFSRIDMALC